MRLTVQSQQWGESRRPRGWECRREFTSARRWGESQRDEGKESDSRETEKRESACGKTESKISKKDDSLKESRQESLDRARDVSGVANDESDRWIGERKMGKSARS